MEFQSWNDQGFLTVTLVVSEPLHQYLGSGELRIILWQEFENELSNNSSDCGIVMSAIIVEQE
jgi:hypothetical protein